MGRQELEEPESSQNYYVVNGSSFQHDYPIGFLPANVESGPLIKIVFITEIDNKVLVCVPFSPWHRQVSRRVLKATLTKPSAVEVLAVPEESREEPQEEAKCMKVWVGLITDHPRIGGACALGRRSRSSRMCFHSRWCARVCAFCQISGGCSFRAFCVPLSREHGSVWSGAQKLDSRMDRLERVVENLSTTFQTFLSPQSSQQAAPKSSIQATPKAQTRKPALRKSGVSLENPYPDLDPGMVEAALASGIEKSSLEQMQAKV